MKTIAEIRRINGVYKITIKVNGETKDIIVVDEVKGGERWRKKRGSKGSSGCGVFVRGS